MASIPKAPYPTAETVIDSGDEMDEDRITVGNVKPSKGGVDSWVVKPATKKGSQSNGKKEDRKQSTGSIKEKSRKWSFGMPPLTTHQRPQHGKSRTMSMSDIKKVSSKEKTTHLPPKLPLDSITTHNFSTNLPTPAASPSSESHPSASTNKKDTNSSETTSAAVKISSSSAPATKNISSTSVAAQGRSSPNRPRSYSAYPISNISHSISSAAAIAGTIKKPPTPISPIAESPSMPALKKPQKASQPAPVAPSSVVSAGSDSSSPSISSGSTGSVEGPSIDSRLANFRKSNNAYFATVSSEVPPSPMPEAPAPPSRGSVSASASEDDSGSDEVNPFEMKPLDTKLPFQPSSSAPTPKATVPPASKLTGARPPVHGRSYSANGPADYGYDDYTPYGMNRKRSSFSSNGSRTTQVPAGSTPLTGPSAAGLGLEASVFEFLDEGEEDAAAAEDILPDTADQKEEPGSTTPLSPHNPISPMKTKPSNTSTLPPISTAAYNQDSYFSQNYDQYGASYPMEYVDYASPEPAPAKPVPTPQSARPMNDTFRALSGEGENAVVRTPQKNSFKEGLQARRAAAAAAAAAEAQSVEPVEIEEYNEEDYGYNNYMPPPQPAPQFRNRRMPPNQPPHDPYAAYPPQPPPNHRSYTDSAYPYHRPQAPQARPPPNPMYPQPYVRGRPPPASVLSGYGQNFGPAGQPPGYASPSYASMMNSNVSEMATTVLGGRFASHMGHGPGFAPSTLSTYTQAYNDYNPYDPYYYDEQNAYAEEAEYEEPRSIPSASPQHAKRRPASTDFSSKRNSVSMHGQWTAEWADTDSNGASSRPAAETGSEAGREEFELGRDGADDGSWARPPKIKRRNTITNRRDTFNYAISEASSKPTSAPSSRMPPVSEAGKSEQSERHPTPLNTQLPPKQKHGLPTPEDSPPAVKECRNKSRPSTMHSHTTSTAFALKNATNNVSTLTTIPVALGYPHLSSHLASSPNNAMYRRFDNLNHRILLHLQDEICELETLLENLDNSEKNAGSGVGLKTRRGINAPRGPGAVEPNSARRLELMGAIFVKLQQYNNALAAYSKVLNELPGASDANIEQYRAWMTLHQPIVPEEMDFVFKANDFATLATDPLTRVSAPRMEAINIPTRPSRSVSFSNQKLLGEGVLEGIFEWIKMQDMPIQIGILASVFFILPLFLFLSTSTYLGIMMLITILTMGFCYCCAQILFNNELSKTTASTSTTPEKTIDAFGSSKESTTTTNITAGEK